MIPIEVDFEVYKALTVRRPSENITENDVLRELLGFSPKNHTLASGNGSASGDWVTKGVRFPVGTQFRAKYKGQTYEARVEGGVLVLDGRQFDTPSKAAMAITKSPVNGWIFWECRLPNTPSWKLIKSLRK